MQLIKHDDEGRCSVFKLRFNNRSILLFNVYLPCADSSIEYRNEVGFYVGFISDMIESVEHTDVIIMGDFNFDINESKSGYVAFAPLLQEFNLSFCDDLLTSGDVYTYVNVDLGQHSRIDHFIVSSQLRQAVHSVEIIDSSLNFSDHRPISLHLSIASLPSNSFCSTSNKLTYKLRWDKGSLDDFYRMSGELLSSQPLLLLRDCDDKLLDNLSDINMCYEGIIDVLLKTEKVSIPRIPCSALKPFWNDHLDELKQDSIFWHNLWLSAGKPSSGVVFNIKRSTKLKYKLAIRQAFALYENQFDDQLYNHFRNKRMPEFWKTWSRKFRHNATRDVYIDGSNDDIYVANAFANHFNRVYESAAVDASNDCNNIKLVLDGIVGENLSDSDVTNLITVELIDKCIRQLKLGKACGPDGLMAEHLLYAHPLLVIHLCALFRAMITSSCVPDGFGCGFIIPLLKDKSGDANSLDNYRGITLVPIIAKLFELIILNICGDYLKTDDLQFGFKNNVGCANAIFAVRSTIDYFRERGSNVYAASLDISKAFDTVNHCKLFSALSKTGIPKWVLSILHNWYNKLNVAVRWKSALSVPFNVKSGVRQGSTLSPFIFNVFMNEFIISLQNLGTGCCVCGHYIGCVLYADDIILLSASVVGLQNMLDCCFNVSQNLSLVFNCSKSCCFVVGKTKFDIADMKLGPKTITWCNSFKYLGVCFHVDSKLKVNTDTIKQKFFAACNSILGNSKSLDELLQLQLHETYCLPLLQYALCSVKLTTAQCADLNSCWNSVFRRIFNFRKYDSVRSFIYGIGRLDFVHLRVNCIIKFVKNCLLSNNVIMSCMSRLFTLSREFQQICNFVDVDYRCINNKSFADVRFAVLDHFASTASC